MKKFIVLVLLMALAAMPMNAKIKFGVKGGLNISSVHFNKDIIDSDNVTGFQIGPMVETTLPLVGLGVDAAVLYSQKGWKLKASDDISTDLKSNYLDIPVNLKWKFGLPAVKGYLAAGPYIGFRLGGDDILDDLLGQVKEKTFAAGLNFGAGVELISLLQVGVNYGLGLTDNYSISKYDVSSKNCGWSITAAIIF